MEKLHHPDIAGSFIGRHSRRRSDAHSPHTPTTIAHSNSDSDISWRDNVPDVNDHDIHQVLIDIDRFNDAIALSSSPNPPEVPDAVETFSRIVESRIVKYYSSNSTTKFGKSALEDAVFLEYLSRLTKLVDGLGNFPASSTTAPCLNRTSIALHRAMTFLEEEIRDILEEIRIYSNPNSKIGREKHSVVDSDRCVLPEPEPKTGEFPTASLETMQRIAKAMIFSGYEAECYQTFYVARRTALEESLRNQGFEMAGIEEVQRTQLEALEADIATWVKTIKQCATVIFPAEQSLCDAVFSDNRSTAVSLYTSLAYSAAVPLLNFADAVVLTKRSAEKLFKYLDMYDALNDLTTAVKKSCPDSHGEDLISELSGAGYRVAEAAVYIFCDLENSIKGDAAKTPVPGGAVHPLTRYVMNYLKYACEYIDTLEQVFKTHKFLAKTISLAKRDDPNGKETNQGSSPASSSPFAVQLMTVMELLDENLEAKSRLYKDISLRYVFLMNNGRYMLQKIKGSAEILQMVGDTWYRTRSTVVRTYHKNYQRETWLKLLKCFSPDGLLVNGKVNKKVVKESFKTFNVMFDEIQKAQSTWVVSDDQLQSELRASISAIVIPAYRSFLGRFRQSLDSGRTDKYIKYQPEDIETLIDGLFDGNSASMSRRR